MRARRIGGEASDPSRLQRHATFRGETMDPPERRSGYSSCERGTAAGTSPRLEALIARGEVAAHPRVLSARRVNAGSSGSWAPTRTEGPGGVRGHQGAWILSGKSSFSTPPGVQDAKHADMILESARARYQASPNGARSRRQRLRKIPSLGFPTRSAGFQQAVTQGSRGEVRYFLDGLLVKKFAPEHSPILASVHRAVEVEIREASCRWFRGQHTVAVRRLGLQGRRRHLRHGGWSWSLARRRYGSQGALVNREGARPVRDVLCPLARECLSRAELHRSMVNNESGPLLVHVELEFGADDLHDRVRRVDLEGLSGAARRHRGEEGASPERGRKSEVVASGAMPGRPVRRGGSWESRPRGYEPEEQAHVLRHIDNGAGQPVTSRDVIRASNYGSRESTRPQTTRPSRPSRRIRARAGNGRFTKSPSQRAGTTRHEGRHGKQPPVPPREERKTRSPGASHRRAVRQGRRPFRLKDLMQRATNFPPKGESWKARRYRVTSRALSW